MVDVSDERTFRHFQATNERRLIARQEPVGCGATGIVAADVV
jgi:hypothetical protein